MSDLQERPDGPCAEPLRRLAAVRAVLGERHEQWISKCGSGCLVSEPVYSHADPAPWPCFHERVRRAVEGTDAAGEAQP